MSNAKIKRHREPGLETIKASYSCEIEIDGKRSAWGRLHNDQRAAILDAVMLLISERQITGTLLRMKQDFATLTVFEIAPDREQRFAIARVKYARVPGREPTIEVEHLPRTR